jgi:hypothetical protein
MATLTTVGAPPLFVEPLPDEQAASDALSSKTAIVMGPRRT